MKDLRLRAGTYPAVNGVLCALGLVLGLGVLLVGVGALVSHHGGDRAWAALGVVLMLLFLVVLAFALVASLSALRPVLVRTGADGSVSLPVGPHWRRVTVPLAQVTTVELEYYSAPRSGRWQLVVHAHGRRYATDSVTSQKDQRKDAEVRRTPAFDAVRQLRAAVVEAQT